MYNAWFETLLGMNGDYVQFGSESSTLCTATPLLATVVPQVHKALLISVLSTTSKDNVYFVYTEPKHEQAD